MESEIKEKKVNAWNIYSFVVLSFVNFVIFTIAFKFFDTEIVGFYLLLTSIFMLGGNLDLGFGVSTVKLISSAKIKNDYKYISEYFFTYLIAYISLVIIILILQYVYFIISASVLSLSEINGINIIYVYFFVALNFVFTFLYNYFRCFLEGLYEYVFLSKVLIILNILLLILSFMIIYFGLSFLWFISLNSIISFILFIIYLFRILSVKNVNLHFGKFNFVLLKENFNYNVKLQLSFFIGNSLDYIIKFLLSLYISIGFVTIYESGKKFITFINGFIYSYQKILLVKISELKTVGSDALKLNEEVFKYSFNSLKLSVVFLAVLNPAICLFLYLWFKNFESVLVFLILALPFSLISILISFYNVLIIEGRDNYLVIIQSINVVLISLFIFSGLYFFKSTIGLLGYYLATIISMYIIFNYFKKFHTFNVKEYFLRVKIYKTLILNAVLLIQIYFIYNDYDFYYMLIGSQILFLIVYYKDVLSLKENIKMLKFRG